MAKFRKSRNVIAIPSESVLTERLAIISAEAKRLKLLIRTARELELIGPSLNSREDSNRE